jgi:hypothetical protein
MHHINIKEINMDNPYNFVKKKTIFQPPGQKAWTTTEAYLYLKGIT